MTKFAIKVPSKDRYVNHKKQIVKKDELKEKDFFDSDIAAAKFSYSLQFSCVIERQEDVV